MIVNTSRFGQVQIDETLILNFPEGLLGFNDLRQFVLLDDPTDDIFAWLQSCESAQVAFPVLEPELFTEAYKVNLTRGDYEALKSTADSKLRYFSIVTIPDDPTQMTANLKAPVVINLATRTARQCVLQDNNLAIREPIFAKLQARVVANPSLSIKDQLNTSDVTIRLPSQTSLIDQGNNEGPGVEI